MNKRKSGFTLMEIMVVIIVIAVLASVAGPMIGSITDQGRASATKSKMSSLKSALLAYQTDVGRLPHLGCAKKASNYDQDSLLSNSDENKNVLYSNSNIGYGSTPPGNYSRRWKGPYMDSDPSDFMMDSWGNRLRYTAKGKNIYLWSAGPDGSFYEPVNQAFKDQSNAEKECDDIVISVARLKSSVK
ncbi:MAG: type II secretion system protein GspG [Candidatus Riflebacteria bacterium]|nr:type II secretion system protein GspG [Candidatus Riflebacteria bacterium]